MFTFVFVVAIAAFVPYVAAPTIQNGVKADYFATVCGCGFAKHAPIKPIER